METVKFGNNTYCGPSVMSAIAGINTDEAARIISSITGKKRVTGVYEEHLRIAFDLIGFKTEKIQVTANTVFGNLFHLTNGIYVFTVPGHYIAIEIDGNHRFICDNRTRSPINISASARLSQKVVSIIKVWRV